MAQLPEDLVQDLRRGYMAAVSFMDFEVGRVLSGLDALGLAKYTPCASSAPALPHNFPGPHRRWAGARRLFVQAEVDMAAMCLLTNKDLLDIGILPLGVRKKLLHTIAQLPEGAQSCFASLCVMEEG